jgi:ParB/RepB/Spo0J family partition protein
MDNKEPQISADSALAIATFNEPAYPPNVIPLSPAIEKVEKVEKIEKTPVEPVSLSKLYFGDNVVKRQVEAEPSPHLIESIKKNGFLGSLVGCRRGWRIELVYGRRRYLAAKAAGLTSIPVHVISLDNESLYWLSLEEFFLQSNLSPLDEAHAIAGALRRTGNLEYLADRIGREVDWLQKRLALIKYADIEQALLDNLIDAAAAYELAQIESSVIRVRFLNQWQAGHAGTTRMLIVPLELPYTPVPLEPVAKQIAWESELGYNSTDDAIFEDLQLLVKKLTDQLEQTTLKSLDANPEWRKPTRKLIKHLIEELQETEQRFKG